MPSTLQRPHVLIVTDDTGLAGFLGEGLIYAGLWTSTIASAVQVLEVFRLRSFDAMVVDAALGGIGAMELVRRLRGQSDRSEGTVRTDIPILIIAATADEMNPELAVASEVSEVLIAPIEIDDLAGRITTAVTSWRAAHPGRPWADAAALGTP